MAKVSIKVNLNMLNSSIETCKSLRIHTWCIRTYLKENSSNALLIKSIESHCYQNLPLYYCYYHYYLSFIKILREQKFKRYYNYTSICSCLSWILKPHFFVKLLFSIEKYSFEICWCTLLNEMYIKWKEICFKDYFNKVFYTNLL